MQFQHREVKSVRTTSEHDSAEIWDNTGKDNNAPKRYLSGTNLLHNATIYHISYTIYPSYNKVQD